MTSYHLTDRDLLHACGRALYGEQWQRALARGLGPLHPKGPRDSLDDRGMRRAAAGERPIPAWWWSAISELLFRRVSGLETERRHAQHLRQCALRRRPRPR